MRLWLVLVFLFALAPGCGDQGGGTKEKGKVEKAVEEVVTKEFKLYEKAKDSIEKAREGSEERREAEKALR